MPTSTFTYNLDGAMTAAQGEPFSTIQRHKYTRLPVEITGAGGNSIALRYDSFGRRLHKTGAQTIFYRSGAHLPASDRTKELETGNEIHHTLIELVDGTEVVYLFTPAGQTILRREHGYARIARDHLRSVRVEVSSTAQITAHYSAFGKSIITGGQLRRAFAGYEPDAETGLYNANRRLYAPTLRLFVSVDPRLQNASPYPYCGSDPFNLIDPTGGISASTISGIIAGLLLVVSIIVTIVTEGWGAPAVGVEAGMVNGGNGALALNVATENMQAVADFTMSTGLETPMPLTIGEFAKTGAAIGAASAVVSNGAALATQAIQGEHIGAWQAVKSMLIEPVIAAVSGGVGGAVAGIGLGAANGVLLPLGMTTLGSAAASAMDSVVNTAIAGQLGKRSGWESIGIQMAVAVGEALAMTLPFSTVPGLPPGSVHDSLSTLHDPHSLESLGQLDRFRRLIKPKVEMADVKFPLKGEVVPAVGAPSHRLRFNIPSKVKTVSLASPLIDPDPQFQSGIFAFPRAESTGRYIEPDDSEGLNPWA